MMSRIREYKYTRGDTINSVLGHVVCWLCLPAVFTAHLWLPLGDSHPVRFWSVMGGLFVACCVGCVRDYHTICKVAAAQQGRPF
jgi:hypothetical protein